MVDWFAEGRGASVGVDCRPEGGTETERVSGGENREPEAWEAEAC